MTIINADSSVLGEVSTQFKRNDVKLGRTHPSNSIKWLLQHERDFVGFMQPYDVVVDQADASFFVYDDALFSKTKTAPHTVGIKIIRGSLILGMAPDQIERLRQFKDESDKPEDTELVPVAEVIFTKQ